MRASPLRRSFILTALAVPAFLNLSCGGDSGGGGGPPEPSSVVVTPGNDTLFAINSTQAYTASVLDDEGHPLSGVPVTWSSADTTVITIDPSTGLATARKNGQSQISAHAGELQGSAISFVAQIVTTVTLTPANAAFTAVGDTVRFTAVAKDAGNTPVAGVQILWSVSDNTVATIDTLGLVKSKGPGTALVSAQAQTRAGYAAIGVDPTVTQFAILSAPANGVAGEPLPTALVVELRDARGNRVMNASLAVNVAPAGAASGTPLHGTTSILADQGRATFTGLWFEKAGTDRLKVTVGALPADSTAQVTVAPAAPVSASIAPMSDFHAAGAVLGLTVQILDRFENTTTDFSGLVQAQLLPGAGLGPLFGNTEVSAVAGVATFTTLNIHKAALSYYIVASLSDDTDIRDTTRALTIVASTPTVLEVLQVGEVSTPFAQGDDDSTIVAVTDSFGNNINNGVLSVAVHATGWDYSAPAGYELMIVSDTLVNVAGGRAIFRTGVSRPGRIRLVFSGPGLAPDTSAELLVGLPNAFGGFFGATDGAGCLTSSFCSGDNSFGQLGVAPGTLASDSLYLMPDSGYGGNVARFDGGARHFCAVVDESSGGYHVKCRGDNAEGQLGGGSIGGSGPVLRSGSLYSQVDALSAGGAHTCVFADGEVWCWGKNDQGQLGGGSAGASTATPVMVVGAHYFTQLSAGGRHSCGLDGSGAIWCWGANDHGQLGDSGVSGSSSATPVLITSDRGFFDVVAGEDFTCGSANGSGGSQEVWCWGRNDAGQLAQGSDSAFSADPVLVVAAPAVLGGGGLVAGRRFACVTTYNIGTYSTRCWGANDHGQLGRAFNSPFEASPAAVSPGLPGNILEHMVAGADYVCGVILGSTGMFACWGRNDNGQFGDGHTGDSNVPVIIKDQY